MEERGLYIEEGVEVLLPGMGAGMFVSFGGRERVIYKYPHYIVGYHLSTNYKKKLHYLQLIYSVDNILKG